MKDKMIITDLRQINRDQILVMTSIGGAPIHEGHTRVITCSIDRARENANHPKKFFVGCGGRSRKDYSLLVVVNCDEFLMRKHGYVFQNENSRAEILGAMRDVDYVYIHKSTTQTVDEVLRIFKPKYFCKGGDRSGPEFMPEIELKAADDVGCRILYGVGGTNKVTSSTALIENIVEVMNERNSNELRRFL